MKLKIYTVYDAKVEAFLTPFFCRTDPEACRLFADAARSVDHSFAKHPEDFALFRIGEFDDAGASIEVGLAPVPLGTALEWLSGNKSGEENGNA